MTRLAQALKPWWPAIAYMGLIALASSQSGHSISLDYVPLRDKGVHFVEFAVLAILIARALAHPHLAAGEPLEGKPRRKVALAAVALATLWGYLDEVHQAFVPGRTADAWDLLADALGSIAGAAIFLAWSRSSARRRASKIS